MKGNLTILQRYRMKNKTKNVDIFIYLLQMGTTWMNLEDIMLREINRHRKKKISVISLLWTLKKSNTQKTQNGGYWRWGSGGNGEILVREFQEGVMENEYIQRLLCSRMTTVNDAVLKTGNMLKEYISGALITHRTQQLPERMSYVNQLHCGYNFMMCIYIMLYLIYTKFI